MINFDVYLNSDEGGRQYIMRKMIEEHNWMMKMEQARAEREASKLPRKGVPSQLIEMQWRSKPPDNIA